MICALLLASVMFHEGKRENAYRDSVGVWTVGYGTNLEVWGILERFMATMGITDDCMSCWTEMHLEDARDALARNYPWAMRMTPARVDVLVEMVYNMGISRVSRFRLMLRALYHSDWIEAEEEALDSKWARQVCVRAERLAKQLRTGEYWNAENCDD